MKIVGIITLFITWERVTMFIELFIVCLIAKLKGYKLKYLFRSWTFYPVLITQSILIMFQISIFCGTFYFVRFKPIVEPAIILAFAFSIFAYKLYKPAIIGAAFVVFGTLLNKFVIAQNAGQMPVYPTLSYITGYVAPEMFEPSGSLHVLGSEATKFKFLTDYIDVGYSILSIGDVLIHLFTCIMLYFLIEAVNERFGTAKQ